MAADGKTYIRKAGEVWVEPKGWKFSIYNKGKVPFVDVFVQRVPKGM